MNSFVTLKFRNLTAGGKARYQYHDGPKLIETLYLEKGAFDQLNPSEYIQVDVRLS